MLPTRGIGVAFAALAVAPACTHSVPINLAPDGGALVGDGPRTFVVAARDGGELVIGPDWDLMITLRDGQRRVIDEPLRVARSDGALRVVDRWGESHFSVSDVASLSLERPDTAGTIAVVAGCSLLIGLGLWGFVELGSFVASPDP